MKVVLNGDFVEFEPLLYMGVKCPIKIFFDGKGNGGILLGMNKYAERIEGLCGNFNTDDDDDFVPKGSHALLVGTSAAEEFGKSWLLTYGSQDKR